MHEQPGAVRLAYGVPESDNLDLFAVCDLEAKVFEIAYFTGDTRQGPKSGARSELIAGTPDAPPTAIPATIQYSELNGEMMVVGRTALPPDFVIGWAGKRVTVAGQGVATTLLAKPAKEMLQAFVDRCAGH